MKRPEEPSLFAQLCAKVRILRLNRVELFEECHLLGLLGHAHRLYIFLRLLQRGNALLELSLQARFLCLELAQLNVSYLRLRLFMTFRTEGVLFLGHLFLL